MKNKITTGLPAHNSIARALVESAKEQGRYWKQVEERVANEFKKKCMRNERVS